MIAANHNGRFQFASSDQIVQRQPKFVALAVSQPANARRQSLKSHALLRQLYPAAQMLIVRKHLQHQLIGARNVGSFAGQRRPAKRSLAFAKQRPNIRGHKSRKVVRVFQALFKRKRSDVISVVESNRAQLLQIQHALDMLRPSPPWIVF